MVSLGQFMRQVTYLKPLKYLNITNKNKYINTLIGKINFVLQVECDNKEFREYLDYLRNKDIVMC